MQKFAQGIFYLIIAWLVTSCTTPGSYMGPLDIKTPVIAQGKLAYPDFIPIDPDLLMKDKSLNAPYQYTVGRRDVMNIIVWNHPELTIPSSQTTSDTVNVTNNGPMQSNMISENQAGILVDDHGEIFYPLVGKIKVQNLTVDQVRILMTQRMMKYIRKPQISVRVSVFRSKPVYVIGDVNKPGTQYTNDIPLTIMDAINQAGGITVDSSDPKHIYVIRGDFVHPKVYWLNTTSPSGVIMGENFQLRPYDVVYISTAGISRWNRVVSQVLPTLQTIWYTRSLIDASS